MLGMPRIRQALPDIRRSGRMNAITRPQAATMMRDAGPTPPGAASACSRHSTTQPRDGEKINVSNIARRADVDLTFLYRKRGPAN